MGKPKPYQPRIGDRIRALMSEGKSLKSICRRKDMPNIQLVMEWLRTEPAFADLYARAIGERAACFAEELVDIADGATESNVNARRLRIETRKWIAARLLPRVYGDRLPVDGSPPIPADPVDVDMLEAARRLAYTLRVGAGLATQGRAAPPAPAPVGLLPAPPRTPVFREVDRRRRREIEINPKEGGD